MNAFAAGFAEKFAPLCPNRAETGAMIHPGHLRRHAKQNLKLRAPGCALEREQPPLEIAQPLSVEIDVPDSVSQNPIASLFEHGIARPPVQQTIVGCPNQLGDHQHLQLEV